MSSGESARGARGFSLVEAIVALGLLASALVISGSFLNSLAASSARLRAQGEMLRELEGTLELMRAGFLPLASGVTVPAGSNPRCPDLQVTVLVEDAAIPGLYRVVARAECTVLRRRLVRTLTTQVWTGA